MKVAVVGSRTFHSYELMKATLSTFDISHIVSGGAMGADKLAERYAKEMGIPTTIFKPDWNGPYGRGAGLARNGDIVDASDMVVAFWDGESHGTLNTINQARKKGKEVKIVYF